jgi:hypothetical protein
LEKKFTRRNTILVITIRVANLITASLKEFDEVPPQNISPLVANQILLEIVSYLPYYELVKYRTVSKAFRDLITNNSLWKLVCLQTCSSTPYLQAVNITEANTNQWHWYKFFRTRIFPLLCSEKELISHFIDIQYLISDVESTELPSPQDRKIGMFMDIHRVQDESCIPVILCIFDSHQLDWIY